MARNVGASDLPWQAGSATVATVFSALSSEREGISVICSVSSVCRQPPAGCAARRTAPLRHHREGSRQALDGTEAKACHTASASAAALTNSCVASTPGREWAPRCALAFRQAGNAAQSLRPGGTKRQPRSSSSRATAMAVPSAHSAATICTPVGKPAAVRITGATAAGRCATLASDDQSRKSK